ncbi:TPA: glycosyltransferase [Klebsiella aerogenes]
MTEIADFRITHAHNEYNSGACDVRNQAIKLVKDDFITGLDDDERHTVRLSSFVSCIGKLSQAKRTCSSIEGNWPY